MKDDVLSMQIEQARNGDEQAIAGLIARQMPQIRSLAAKAVRPGLDFDDAVQEGIIGLFSALETFDAQKGAAFATYANVCVQNAIVSAVRAAGRSALQSGLALVIQDHFIAALNGGLGNTAAHQAGTDDENFADFHVDLLLYDVVVGSGSQVGASFGGNCDN